MIATSDLAPRRNTAMPVPPQPARPRPLGPAAAALLCLGLTSACASLGGTGPSTGAIRSAQEEGQRYADTAIQVLPLDAELVAELGRYDRAASFAELFGDGGISATVLAPGDLVDIAIWEAPPAVLFGAAPGDLQLGAGGDLANNTPIPRQQVDEEGMIAIPFVGRIKVLGMRPEQVESLIVARLRRRANDPQAVVRLVANETRTATILGEVASSRRIGLSARGERLLDALAVAGGTKQPIEQSTVQLARGTTRAVMPLERVIADPAQNVRLLPGDVLTVQHQPFSFVALGAVQRPAEVPFEGGGITLAEALGRAGGLNERRADVKGVFVFRLEDRAALPALAGPGVTATADGRVPVVYTLHMTDAASLFAMQDFRMRDGDVLYISTAPGVELERFLQTISSTAFSIVATANAIQRQ
ncbi:MAG: polysaccharide export protein [Porphyrobacter sp.]|nr:polysaccharide export protein [Porphyrobacter sp.]